MKKARRVQGAKLFFQFDPFFEFQFKNTFNLILLDFKVSSDSFVFKSFKSSFFQMVTSCGTESGGLEVVVVVQILNTDFNGQAAADFMLCMHATRILKSTKPALCT